MNTVKGKFTAIRDNVIVTDMEFGEQRTKSGLIIRSDDGTAHGVKPRWGRVWAVGPAQKDVRVGDWILVAHGRWTRGIEFQEENSSSITIRRVETDAILMTCDEKPTDVSLGVE